MALFTDFFPSAGDNLSSVSGTPLVTTATTITNGGVGSVEINASPLPTGSALGDIVTFVQDGITYGGIVTDLTNGTIALPQPLDVDVNGAQMISGTSGSVTNVEGDTQILGDSFTAGSTTVQGNSTVEGNTIQEGDVTHNGDTFTSNAENITLGDGADGTTTIAGATTTINSTSTDINGTVNLGDTGLATTIEGSLSVAENTMLNGEMNVIGDGTDGTTTINGASTTVNTATVTLGTDAAGTVTVENDLTVDGATTTTGLLTATGGVAGNVTGNVTGDLTGTASMATLAAQATALETAQNFSASGDATATGVLFDGTGAVDLVLELSPGSVDSAEIAANAVGTSAIADNAVTTAKLAASVAGIGLTIANGALNVNAINVANTFTYTSTSTTQAAALTELIADINGSSTVNDGVADLTPGDLFIVRAADTATPVESYIYVGSTTTFSGAAIGAADLVDISNQGGGVTSVSGGANIDVDQSTGAVTASLSTNVDVAGTLDVTGLTTLDDLRVDENTDLSGTLMVGGSTELNGMVDLSADSGDQTNGFILTVDEEDGGRVSSRVIGPVTDGGFALATGDQIFDFVATTNATQDGVRDTSRAIDIAAANTAQDGVRDASRLVDINAAVTGTVNTIALFDAVNSVGDSVITQGAGPVELGTTGFESYLWEASNQNTLRGVDGAFQFTSGGAFTVIAAGGAFTGATNFFVGHGGAGDGLFIDANHGNTYAFFVDAANYAVFTFTGGSDGFAGNNAYRANITVVRSMGVVPADGTALLIGQLTGSLITTWGISSTAVSVSSNAIITGALTLSGTTGGANMFAAIDAAGLITAAAVDVSGAIDAGAGAGLVSNAGVIDVVAGSGTGLTVNTDNIQVNVNSSNDIIIGEGNAVEIRPNVTSVASINQGSQPFTLSTVSLGGLSGTTPQNLTINAGLDLRFAGTGIATTATDAEPLTLVVGADGHVMTSTSGGGSTVGFNAVDATASVTVTAADDLIILRGIATDQVITLPASPTAGKSYKISNLSSAMTGTWSLDGGAQIFMGGALTTIDLDDATASFQLIFTSEAGWLIIGAN